MISFLQFRSNALSSLNLVKRKNNFKSKEDKERWIKDMYEESNSVDLIASGYEWTCEHCNSLNKEIEITGTVICKKCCEEYFVSNIEHAGK